MDGRCVHAVPGCLPPAHRTLHVDQGASRDGPSYTKPLQRDQLLSIFYVNIESRENSNYGRCGHGQAPGSSRQLARAEITVQLSLFSRVDLRGVVGREMPDNGRAPDSSHYQPRYARPHSDNYSICCCDTCPIWPGF